MCQRYIDLRDSLPHPMNRPVLLLLLVLGSCAVRDADVENWSTHDTIEWAKHATLCGPSDE